MNPVALHYTEDIRALLIIFAGLVVSESENAMTFKRPWKSTDVSNFRIVLDSWVNSVETLRLNKSSWLLEKSILGRGYALITDHFSGLDRGTGPMSVCLSVGLCPDNNFGTK